MVAALSPADINFSETLSVRGTTTWTIARHDGPKHLVL